MKKKLTSLTILLFNTAVFSQVGINTDNPKSTLDISVKNTGGVIDNTQSYGLQAPRLSRADLSAIPETNYGTDQKGAMIYITDISGGITTGQKINVTAIGYYYFDGSVWVKVTDGNTTNTGTSTEPWNESGKTTPATANNQNIYQTGNIGIRSISPATALDITGSTGTTDDDVSIRSIGTGSQAGAIGFERSEGTLTAPTAVATGDNLGSLTFSGNDGSAQNVRARIDGVVNGAVSTGVVPTDLTFTTGANTNATADASTVAERMRITSTGRIGIGMATPRQTLEVAGFVRANGFTNAVATLSTTTGVQDFGIFNARTTPLRITTPENARIQFHTDGLSGGAGNSNFSRGGTDPLLMLTKKVVGIGVPASRDPNNTLEIVSATTGTSGVRLTNLPSANFLATDSNGDVINATLPAGTEPWFQAGSTNQATANNQNIYQSGNIGIRSMSPATALDITGAMGTTDDNVSIRSIGASGSQAGGIGFERSRGTLTAPATVATGDNLGSLTFSGNDGTNQNIGARIDGVVNGAVSTGVVPTDLTFTTGTATNAIRERMRITSNGRVGIGTTTPSQSLDVAAGDMRVNSITNGTFPAYVANSSMYIMNQFVGGETTIAVRPGTIFKVNTDADVSNRFQGGETTLHAYNGKVGVGLLQDVARNTLEVLSEAPGTSGVRLTNLPGASFLGTDGNGDIISVTLPTPTPTPVRINIYGNINTGSKSVASLISTGSSITLPAGSWLVKVGQMINSTLPGSSVDNMWMNLTLSSENVDGANATANGFGFFTNNTVSGWLAPAATASGANSFLEGSFSIFVQSGTSATIYPKFSTVEKTTSYSASQSVTTQNSTSNYLYAVPLN
ncbi:beta strand repeat-containing protein [Empedobacter sp. UBA7248]|uniref:beta strand repeat-containing protein n=1 Tax=Empedobacter sp. UBA7248 TaxID=1946448 RepID=UPI0025C4BDA2|nr:hypothetical protein [Empedobacter sp. UBA7248]